jgi:hypothetical protein
VAYNQPDEVYFVIQEPMPITEGSNDKVSCYSCVTSAKAKNSVVALR